MTFDCFRSSHHGRARCAGGLSCLACPPVDEAGEPVRKQRLQGTSLDCGCGCIVAVYLPRCPCCTLAVVSFLKGVGPAAHAGHDPSIRPRYVPLIPLGLPVTWASLQNHDSDALRMNYPAPLLDFFYRLSPYNHLMPQQAANMGTVLLHEFYAELKKSMSEDAAGATRMRPLHTSAAPGAAFDISDSPVAPRKGKNQRLRDLALHAVEARSAAALHGDLTIASESADAVYDANAQDPIGPLQDLV